MATKGGGLGAFSAIQRSSLTVPNAGTGVWDSLLGAAAKVVLGRGCLTRPSQHSWPAQPAHFDAESHQTKLRLGNIRPTGRYALTGWSIARAWRVARARNHFS